MGKLKRDLRVLEGTKMKAAMGCVQEWAVLADRSSRGGGCSVRSAVRSAAPSAPQFRLDQQGGPDAL